MPFRDVRRRISRRLERLSHHEPRNKLTKTPPPSSSSPPNKKDVEDTEDSPSQEARPSSSTSVSNRRRRSPGPGSRPQHSLDQAAAAAVPLPPSPRTGPLSSDSTSSLEYFTPQPPQTEPGNLRNGYTLVPNDPELSRTTAATGGLHADQDAAAAAASSSSSKTWTENHQVPRSVEETVDYTTHMNPAVVQEHVMPHVHTIHHIQRSRSIHFHEHRYRIQPIIDTRDTVQSAQDSG